MELIVMLAVVLIGAGAYFLPSVVAHIQVKRNLPAIFALNLLLGWTVLGWVGALVWALMAESDEFDAADDWDDDAVPHRRLRSRRLKPR